MDVLRRCARSRAIAVALGSVILCGITGCAEWISSLSNGETWEKMSPSNVWYNMQPHRLQRLNQEDGLPSDVYYSVPDPIPPAR